LPRRSAATALQRAVGPTRLLGDWLAWRINGGLSPFYSPFYSWRGAGARRPVWRGSEPLAASQLAIRALTPFSFFVTVCAYPVRWFASAGRFFKRIDRCTNPWLVQAVALFLCIPCFKISNFFLKVSYFLNKRRVFLSQVRIARVDLPEFRQQRIAMFEAERRISGIYQRLCGPPPVSG
jgi:hypothetical protein